MSEFLIDRHGNQIWYDIKSNIYNCNDKITHKISYQNKPTFYIRFHREDGPAYISNNIQMYFLKGMCSRENGPAKIWMDGYLEYWKNNFIHREDGPAIIFPNGNTWWYFNDTHYSFEDWCEKLDKSEEEINFLRLKWNVI